MLTFVIATVFASRLFLVLVLAIIVAVFVISELIDAADRSKRK